MRQDGIQPPALGQAVDDEVERPHIPPQAILDVGDGDAAHLANDLQPQRIRFRGLAEEVAVADWRGLRLIQRLLKEGSPTLLYISCNFSRFWEEYQSLKEAYRLERVQFYDFFPHTPHLESLLLLRRRP